MTTEETETGGLVFRTGDVGAAVDYLRRVSENSVDVVSASGAMGLKTDIGPDLKEHPGLAITGYREGFTTPVTDFALKQLARSLNIPSDYAMRMRDNGLTKLLEENVNTWLSREPAKKRLVRIFDDHVRAVLSGHYRVVDNFDVLLTTLDITREIPNAKFVQCHVSETKVYLDVQRRDKEFVLPAATDGGKPEVYHPGLYVRNSEVGDGALVAIPVLWRQVCTNGLVAPHKLRQVHVGKEMSEGIFTRETRQAEARAMLLRLRDIIRDSLTTFEVFEEQLAALGRARDIKIPDVAEYVGNISAEYGLLESERASILQRILADPTIEGLRDTPFGVVQAITATAGDAASPDRMVELQTIAGKVAGEKA